MVEKVVVRRSVRCWICGRRFLMVERHDAAYCCSAACRQKAYRIRKKGREDKALREGEANSSFGGAVDAGVAEMVAERSRRSSQKKNEKSFG